MSVFTFQNPSLDNNGDARGLLAKIWTAETNPIVGKPIFWGRTDIPGIRYLPHTPGGVMQTVFRSTMTQAYANVPGAGAGAGAVTGRVELLTPKNETFIEQKLTYSDNDINHVPTAIQNMAKDKLDAQMSIERQFDGQVFLASFLAARQPSLSATVGGVTLPCHQGGTVVRKGGNSTTPATALANRYSPDATGGGRALNDIKEMVREAENKGIDLDNAVLYLHLSVWQALMELETDKIFSKDYINEGDGNNIVRREIRRIAGLRIHEEQLRFRDYFGGTGHLPNANLSVAGASNLYASLPSGLRANFLPTSTTGMPVALIMGENPQNNDAGAVHVMIHQPLTNYIIRDDEQYLTKYMMAAQATVAPINPVCAVSLEVTSNAV